jgi:hypothetical protein
MVGVPITLLCHTHQGPLQPVDSLTKGKQVKVIDASQSQCQGVTLQQFEGDIQSFQAALALRLFQQMVEF